MNRLSLSLPPEGKGLVIKLAIDGDYCGFSISCAKIGFSIGLGFIALRVYFVSEARLNYFESIVTIKIFAKAMTYLYQI